MELARRYQHGKQLREQDIARVLDAAAADWVEVNQGNDSGSFFDYRVGYLMRAAKESGLWFEWEHVDETFRIIRLDAYARLVLEAAKDSEVRVRCPVKIGDDRVDYIAHAKWIAKIKAIKEAARLDDTRFVWNREWFKSGCFCLIADQAIPVVHNNMRTIELIAA
jgi:hypothetical protein